MKDTNNSIESGKNIEQKSSIKKLLKEKNLNAKNDKDLKYLLSLSLLPKINKYKINFKSLISFLFKYKTKKNENLFYDFFFQSCELGKIDNVKILIQHNLDINRQNEIGETPLHIAVAKNDEELVKLLMQQEPKTDLVTNKDGFSAINYAEICGNKNIIEMIAELEEKNAKKRIKSEIADLIQKDMNNLNVDNTSYIDSIENKENFNDIENYNGEKLSMLINDDSNSSKTKSINKNVNNKVKKEDKSFSKTLLINDSELCDDISPKNTIKVSNYNNYKIDSKNKISLKEINIFPSPLKKKESNNINLLNSISIKSSYLQSLKTSHSLSKEHELSPILKNKITKIIDKKIELIKFILELNLPEKYAEILIENGFDDLDVLTKQMKLGLSLTYQNLKDIGLGNPGERAKILIHLEEISDNFDFILDKEVIYCNKLPEEKSGSLFLFLKKINLEEYFNNFLDNGYNNAELLFVQMSSKNPINEEILKNDIGIKKLGHLQRIMFSLKEETKKYINNLEKNCKKYKSVEFEDNPYVNSCQACFIF